MNTQETVATDDLAQTLGTTSMILRVNFKRHSKDFKENVHYVLGKDKSYLWTVQGIFTHAWILKTAPAKAACEKLIDRVAQPQVDVVSLQDYQKLQEQLAVVQVALSQALEIPPASGVDYALYDELEILLGRIRESHDRLCSATKDADIRKALEHQRPLLKRLEAILTGLEEMDDHLDGKFIQQASTLHSLIPVSTVPMIEGPKA